MSRGKDTSLPSDKKRSKRSAEGHSNPETEVTELQKRRRRIMDLDHSTCRTRLSHRRFLIQMQSSSSSDLVCDPVRFWGGSGPESVSGRVVDWD